MSVSIAKKTQARIWARIIDPDQGNLTPAAARFMLDLDFRPSDQRRVAALSSKANEGVLTDAERSELEEYIRVGEVLAILQSKARRSLKNDVRET